jgi:hypothetical protein
MPPSRAFKKYQANSLTYSSIEIYLMFPSKRGNQYHNKSAAGFP